MDDGILRLTRVSCAFAALALAGAACTPMRMKVPPTVRQAATPLPVDGRGATGLLVDESFTFGAFRVHDVDRQWDQTRGGTDVFGPMKLADSSTTSGGYTFMMTHGAGVWRGVCMTGSHNMTIELPVATWRNERANMTCRCADQGSEAGAQVQVSSQGNVLGGALELPDGNVELRATRELEGSSLEMGKATGYIVGADVAAVDVTQPGSVWLPTDAGGAQRQALACVAAALLLYPDN